MSGIVPMELYGEEAERYIDLRYARSTSEQPFTYDSGTWCGVDFAPGIKQTDEYRTGFISLGGGCYWRAKAHGRE